MKGLEGTLNKEALSTSILCSSQCRCQSWDTPPRIRGSGRRARRRSTRPPAAGCRRWWGSWWGGGGRSTAARHTPAIFISCSQPAVRLQSGCSAAAWSVHSLQSRKNAVESWQQLVGISDTPSQIRKILYSVDTLGHYEQLNEGNIIFQITWEKCRSSIKL